MAQRLVLFFSLFLLFSHPCFSQGNAPPEAYLEGSALPYFGTEDAWNRRAYQKDGEDDYKEYGRFGQRQMLDIVEGRLQEAVEYCRKTLRTHPRDPESLFNLAIAFSQMGNTEDAVQAMQDAVAAGLPFERFLAGPRDLLAPLTDTAAYKALSLRYAVRLIHGPMLGRVTANSASFWVRTAEESPVRAVVSTSPGLEGAIHSTTGATRSEQEFTCIVRVDGLEPDTTYYYDILVDGRPSLERNLPSFKTYPLKGERKRFQVAFGGGAMYIPDNERMWKTVLSHAPSAFLFLGDNVYIDMPWHVGALHHYTYYRRQSSPEYRRMVASTPIYAVWDDHDSGIDDIWLGPYRDKPSWKMPTFRIFRNNWINPGYGDPDWPGTWFRFSLADVDLFLLDGRFYRTNPYGDRPTMLGPVQKAWLKKELKESRATFKVLASPVPWTFYAKGGALDDWNGFREERKELFDFLAENRIDGVILISADRHRSDAWRIEREGGYTLYEFESSRLTNDGFHELMPGALFGYNEKCSFGLLTFDTTLEDPTVTYQIVSIDNEVVHSLTLKKSEISH